MSTSGSEMAVRSSCASSKMAMEKNVDLVRLEGRIYASLSESRERLLRMQVLRGVLDHERMLLRISAQERDMERVKKEQRRLQVRCISLHTFTYSFIHSLLCLQRVVCHIVPALALCGLAKPATLHWRRQ